MTVRSSIEGARLRARGWSARLSNLGWGLGAASGVLHVLSYAGWVSGAWEGAAVILGVLTLVASPLAFAASAFVGRRRTHPRGWVEAEGRSLRLASGSESRTLGPFVAGWQRALGLRLIGRSGTELDLDLDAADARALLSALGLDVASERASFAWYRPRARIVSFVAVYATIAALFAIACVTDAGRAGEATTCAGLFVPVVLAELGSRLWSWRRVTVGREGIEVVSSRGRQLFRFADLRALRTDVGSLLLDLRDGSTARIWADTEAGLDIAIRVRQALAAARPGIPRVLLARGERTLADWRRDIARSTEAGFREGALEPAALAELLADPAASAEQRIAAALALGSSEAGRPKVRAFAAAVASPRLRVALEALAEGELDEAAVEQALKETQ